MNLWDCENRLFIGLELIPKKRNEIEVLSEMLEGVDIKEAELTADAMNTQPATAESICAIGPTSLNFPTKSALKHQI